MKLRRFTACDVASTYALSAAVEPKYDVISALEFN